MPPIILLKERTGEMKFINRKGRPIKFKTELDRKQIESFVNGAVAMGPRVMAYRLGQMGFVSKQDPKEPMILIVEPKTQEEMHHSLSIDLGKFYMKIACADSDKEPVEADAKMADKDYATHKTQRYINEYLLSAILPFSIPLKDNPEKWFETLHKLYPNADIKYKVSKTKEKKQKCIGGKNNDVGKTKSK